MAFLEIATKLFIAMIALWTMTKILGKKEISQLTAFDFVSSLMLSELVGNTIYEEKATIAQLLFALGLWTAMSYALEKFAFHFPWLSKRVSGSPELIIRDGLVDEKALKRNNLDLDQLHTLMRQQQVFSFKEIAYAIFETDGSLSILRKSSKDNVTREDLALPDTPVSLPTVVIANGHIDEDALRFLGKDKTWLLAELHNQDIDDTHDVVLAEWTEQHRLHVQKRNDPHASFAVPVG
jgi:uncharacterized membrane protein YcaP (DUF421 family)